MNVALNLALDGAVIGTGIGAILLYAVLGVLLMLLGFFAVDLTTPGPLNRQVRAGAPNAVLVTAAGMVGIAFIVVVSIYTSTGDLLDGLLSTLIFGIVGVVAQVLAPGCWSGSRGSTWARCWRRRACRPRPGWSARSTSPWAWWWRWPSSNAGGRPTQDLGT